MRRVHNLQFLFLILILTATQFLHAENIKTDNSNNKDIKESTVVPVTVVSIVCLSIAVVLCLGLRSFFSKLCPDNSFKDLENENGFFNDIAISTVPAVSFPMYPPVVNSSYDVTAGYNTEQVYFEPLPDLSQKYCGKAGDWSNLGRVRPKIAQLQLNRSEGVGNDEYMVDVEMRKKIEKIFCSNKSLFPRSQLQYIKELGTGWFGKVLQGEAHDIQPGKKKTKVIVMMLKEGISNVDKSFFLQEAFAYREIDNANVLKLFCHCVETTPILNIFEFCQLGNLKSFIASQKNNMEQLTKQNTQLNVICDVAAGLQCLHQHNYVHRDLAMRNCLVTSDLVVKIGDYGLSEQNFKEEYYHDLDGVGIPVRWMAPESLSVSDTIRVNNVTKEANIWTFGVVVWELLRCGDLPYSDLNDLHVIRLVAKEKVVKLSKPNIDMDNIGHLCELMEMCWRHEPSERPSVRELRIMLLHLLSNKNQADLDFFEEKWNQLKPRPVVSSTSQGSFSDLRQPGSRQFNLREPVRVQPQPRPQSNESSGQAQEGSTSKSFPPLAPVATGNELSLAEELNMSASKNVRVRNDKKKFQKIDDDLKSNVSQLSGTEDGFEMVSVDVGGPRKGQEDEVGSDKFSFIHAEDVEFGDGNGVPVSKDTLIPAESILPNKRSRMDDQVKLTSTPIPVGRGDLSDQSRSPARPNFVDLLGPANTPLSAVTPSKSDSRSNVDEFSPMVSLSDNSLLKMDKYCNYLHTAVMSMENDESMSDATKNKASPDFSFPDDDDDDDDLK